MRVLGDKTRRKELAASWFRTRCEGSERLRAVLSDWPMERPRNWVALVNQPMTEKGAEAIQTCIARNRPYGDDRWQEVQAKRLGLMHTLRREGRPKAIRRVSDRKN